MRYALSCLVLFSLGSIAQADHTVFLNWQGEVSAPVTLQIQGDRLEVESRVNGALTGDSFTFNRPLGRAGRDVKVNVLEGAGTVRILEQPSTRNDFAAVVRITPPRRGGSTFHRLEFTTEHAGVAGGMDDGDRPFRRANRGQRNRNRMGGPGELTWYGRVDNEVVVTVQGQRASSTAIRGRSVVGEQIDFSSRLPNTPVQVTLVGTQGRGRIELLEQPSAANGYAAKVRIMDQQNGEGEYEFTLQWDGGSSASSGGGLFGDVTPSTSSAGSFSGARRIVWSGRVDGKVRLSIQGNRSWVDRISGGPVSGAQVDFGSALPRNSQVQVRKVSGRDDVEVVEEPSSSNGYKLVIEIDDNDAGAGDYVIEVTW